MLRLYFLFLSSLFLYPAVTVASSGEDCVSCHQQVITKWSQSDHARAMSAATADSVLGDFSGVSISHYSQTARFYQENAKFVIEFTEADVTKHYEVSYTFGHFPLQQYLVKMPGGRLQVFPFAWDSRAKREGGQRWYPIYAHENISPADRLHWQQPLQNWNGMCADCHSDGLKRNYKAETNTFHTTFDNVNVGCQSCHGKMDSQHAARAKQSAALPDPDELKNLGQWLLSEGEAVATWQGAKRDNTFMDTCFACHSLRSPLNDGVQPELPFLDQFSPTLLGSPLYHPDGQIKEEVYVYGSFLQSKMFAAGVNCLDCHDSHTMKVKVANNGLCLQCHNSQNYQTQQHLNHPFESDGAQCVNCHMPATTYMGVDARRDHSFKKPRPNLTVEFGIPNACSGCHVDKDATWASEQVEKLWRSKQELTENERNYIRLQHQQYLPLSTHLAIVNDTNLSEIVRASALVLLPNSTMQLGDSDIKAWVSSPDPLIRLATAQIGYAIPAAERSLAYVKLLDDEYKAVRIAAVNHLLYLNIDTPAMFSALNELISSTEKTLWRGEGGLNLSMIQLNTGDLKASIASLRHSLAVDPYFDAAYVNLAETYRQLNDIDREKEVLTKGLKANPDSASLHFSFAMHLVREGDKQAALPHLRNATGIAPRNVQFAYTYFVAMDNLGKTRQALSQLTATLKRYNNHPQLVNLGLGFAQKIGDSATFDKLYQHTQ